MWVCVYENFHLWLQFVQLFKRVLEITDSEKSENKRTLRRSVENKGMSEKSWS